jgi:Flp pilus assembly protein TadG
MISTRFQKHECGQSLIEFAVGTTILILLLAGVVDLGRAFFTYIALRDAAQEGAVYGSICPKDANKIEERALSSSNLPINLATDPNVVVECKFITASGATDCNSNVPAPGNGILVRVRYTNFPLTMPLLSSFIGTQTITIQAEVQDTILRDKVCN